MSRFLLLLLVLAACASTPTPETPSVIPTPTPLPAEAETLRNEGMELLFSKDPLVKNPLKAKEKFQAAAALGDPISMDQLGGFYATGEANTPRDCRQALEWFEKSSQSGYPLAINNLAYTLVSCPEHQFRNAEKAEELVRFLYQANPTLIALLDTYAALLAEQGHFKQAAKTLEVVLDIAELTDMNPERIDETKAILQRYRRGKKLP